MKKNFFACRFSKYFWSRTLYFMVYVLDTWLLFCLENLLVILVFIFELLMVIKCSV